MMESNESTPLINGSTNHNHGDGIDIVNNSKEDVPSLDTVTIPICNVVITRSTASIFIAVINVLSQVGMNISLPTLSKTIESGHCHSNQFFVLFYSGLWFPILFWAAVVIVKLCRPTFNVRTYTSHKYLILLGALNAVNGLLVVYASPPSRTSPSLQAILSTTIIPYTVVLRYIILRKGVSYGRLICTVGTLIGLFISLEPNIFNINQKQSSGSASAIWPFVFALGFLPVGVANVLQEREIMKDNREESLVFEAWMQVYNFAGLSMLFWTDFIPGFGEAKTFKQFQNQMNCGFMSQFTGNKFVHFPWAAGSAWVFIIFYCIANMSSLLLIRYADGAIYLVVVQALVTPLAAFFWTLFTLDNGFHWHPNFSVSTGFIVGGVAVILPCVILYNYFGMKEQQEAQRQLENSHSHKKESKEI
ncbi:Crt-like protein 1 [Trichoplax sp. H2]|nr:Crt-like protein 1 [Trichoplax sp. H2]|eukprot:RDD45575.1 Crt-like protein 1 [Trichoplax sp. H2]